MLQSLFKSIMSVIGLSDFEIWMETFGAEGDVLLIVVLTSCILVLLTVSFVFKFILKLVDR